MKNSIHQINLVKMMDIKYFKKSLIENAEKILLCWDWQNKDKNIVCLFFQMLA